MITDPAILTNITLDVFAVAVSLIVLICFRSASRSRQTHLFFVLLITDMIGCICDIACWLFEAWGLRRLTLIGNILTYLACYAMGAAYIIYAAQAAGLSPRKTRTWTRTAIIMALSASFLSVCANVMEFCGLTYHGGINMVGTPVYRAFQYLGGSFILMAVGVVLAKRRNVAKRDIHVIMLYAALPIISTFLQYVYPNLWVVLPAITLSLLAVYATVFVQQRDKLIKRETELTEAKLNMAISQIQPHFLYNSLNSIAQMCAVAGAEDAEQATVEFARYLRGNLESLSHAEPIDFAQELKHTQTYAKLEKLRYGDGLELAYEIETVAFKIPALSLQPLVENAITHGLGAKAGGKVTVKSYETDSGWYVTVTDNGVGFDTEHPPEPKGTSIGIENVRARLMHRVGGRLTVTSTPGLGTEVTVYIPKQRTGEGI